VQRVAGWTVSPPPTLFLSHLLFLIDLFTSSTCVSSDFLSLWAVVAVDIQQVCRKIQICVFKFSLFSLSSTFITSSAEREKRENFNTDILFSFYTCCVSTPTADREKIWRHTCFVPELLNPKWCASPWEIYPLSKALAMHESWHAYEWVVAHM